MKRFLTLFLTTAICISFCVPVCLNAKTESNEPKLYSGTLNETVTYDIDENGIVTFTGTGAITNTPREVETLGKRIVVKEGITELGDKAFIDAKNVTEIMLPDSLIKIGSQAMARCRKLKALIIPKNVTEIGENVINACEQLRTVVNKSKTAIALPTKTYMATKPYYRYYVDGKEVTEVKSGKTATSKPKKYKIKLYANKGKVVGKTPKTYTYGKTLTLPKATKKGYSFIGWSQHKEDSTSIGSMTLSDCIYGGTQKRYAHFAKVSIKGENKKLIVSSTNCREASLLIEYSTKKNMKNNETVWVGYNPKTQKVESRNAKTGEVLSNITGSIDKKGKAKCTIRGIKSGKTYYVRLRYSGDKSGDGMSSSDLGIYFGKTKVVVK